MQLLPQWSQWQETWRTDKIIQGYSRNLAHDSSTEVCYTLSAQQKDTVQFIGGHRDEKSRYYFQN
jgi:hypothetical protein